MSAIVFLSSDLMFSSRLGISGRELGVPVEVVARAAALREALQPDCRLVIVDLALEGLDLAGVIAAVRVAAPQARVVAFGAHVNEAALTAAATAGCDEVLTRGQFNKQYAELLRQSAV
jgi:DNA-binding NarL/FixJ family response regulator